MMPNMRNTRMLKQQNPISITHLRKNCETRYVIRIHTTPKALTTVMPLILAYQDQGLTPTRELGLAQH